MILVLRASEVVFRIYPTMKFNFGVDGGYAMGATENTQSGIFFRPMMQVDVFGNAGFYASYNMVTLDDSQWSTITAGLILLL